MKSSDNPVRKTEHPPKSQALKDFLDKQPFDGGPKGKPQPQKPLPKSGR